MLSKTLLLRLLLCFTLVLNGISGASAAVRMALPQAQHQMASAAVIASSSNTHPPRCHADGIQPFASSASHPGPHHPAAGTSTAPTDDKACCNTTACQCACAHPCAADIVAFVIVPAQRPAPDRSRALDLSHRAPALPHLIRPPIG